MQQAVDDAAEPAWRNTKLSLERPYKDDDENLIQTLLDITPDGQFKYEPILDQETKLGERFRRIFIERGTNFFETDKNTRYGREAAEDNHDDAQSDAQPDVDDPDGEQKFMTPEALLKMRWDIKPRLDVALGEMSQARDLLALLLSMSGSTPSGPTVQSLTAGSSNLPVAEPSPSLTPGLLTASTVTPLPSISSVQAFDAELIAGGKDDALRKASEVLHVAADGVERSMSRTDSFWADALRIRRANCTLVPAPLPIGAPTGKGADKTSKDFLISFGLSQSAPIFRRSAIAHMAFYNMPSASEAPLVFPHRKRVRLRVALKKQDTVCHSQIIAYSHETLEGAIRDAQKEVIESEIFDELIKEASTLPTASTRVSERLIIVDAAHDTELSFELIEEEQVSTSNRNQLHTSDLSSSAICDLISSVLPLLLLRRHEHVKSTRLGQSASARGLPKPTYPTNLSSRPGQGPQILQPIIDLIQYQAFLARIKVELNRAVERLRKASVEAEVQFRGIGESGSAIVNGLVQGKERVGGEAILRIDVRHNIRFTFSSPSSLTAHLPHATINIASIPQLCQLLADETERSLLGRVCAIGTEACQSLSGAWFIDDMMSRAVGRWEGCVLNFRVRCTDAQTLECHAHQLLRERPGPSASAASEPAQTPQRTQDQSGQLKVPNPSAPVSTLLSYGSRSDKNVGLFAWVKQVVEDTLANS